jgi:MerR family redox-sensitive transcriptional activator SoxR
MHAMAIGDLARQAGLAPSAIRYYEKIGLMPAPPRRSGQRRYDSGALGRLRVIQLARDVGFSIEETRMFLSGFPPDTAPAARWRALAVRKMAELDALIARSTQIKAILEASFRCGCVRLEECERYMAQHPAPSQAR